MSITSNENKNRKIFVGMSGGVDSAVSALLLKEQGYDVTGVYIKTWQPDYIECTSKEDRLDAMRICAKLDIPFITLGLENEYKRNVIDYLLNEYKNNRVPNPDVMCNKYIKFGAFLDYARAQGCRIATGHYSKIQVTHLATPTSVGETMHLDLHKHKDKSKDQTYFLYQVKQEDLKDILFPLQDLNKSEVKEIARVNSLHVADKKESMGICMLGDISVKDFLMRELSPNKGEVCDEEDNVIGTHDGVILYTLGERHGFEVTKKSQDAGHKSNPYFVYEKDLKNNILYVKQNEDKFGVIELEKKQKDIVLQDCNSFLDLSKINETKTYQAQSRYHGELYTVKVKIIGDTSNMQIKITPEHSDMPAIAGQSLVVYDEDEVVLGGVIS
jgi:tRNA-uridine 2-sulfurtransferase